MKLLSKLIIILMLFNTFIFTSYGQEIGISAESAIVIDAKTGRVLFEKNAHKRMYMASTTKIMTALVALEKGNPNNMVKINGNSTNIEGSSIYLQEGEIMLLKDLLYGLMLCSGNDAACAIAQHIGGNIDNFVNMMNEKATELKLENTHFTNPHGLHNADHYTSAYDLAIISKEAMHLKSFKKIVGTKLWVAQREGDRYKYFYNKNKVLTQYQNGTGVKIGYTKVAGRCLVASAEKNGMEIICVVLNAPNWFNDSYHLMNYIFDKYKPIRLIEKNQIFKTIDIENGSKDTTKIIPSKEIVLPLAEEEINKIFLVYSIKDQLVAPIKRKQKIGVAKIYLDNKLLMSVDMITREDIDFQRKGPIELLKNITINRIKN